MSQPLDIFNDDAFSLSTLTAAINNIDHVPGRVGDLVFVGISEGIPTTRVSVERKGDAINLIATSARGAPAQQEREAKAEMIDFDVPQIKLESTINAHELQDVRAYMGAPADVFGDRLRGAQNAVTSRMNKMTSRHDLTLEHHRLGALKGQILDADGSVLVDLFEEFGVLNSFGLPAPEEFDFELDDWSQSAFNKHLRQRCAEVIRAMHRVGKVTIPKEARVWALCGDNFFDKFLEHPSVKRAYDGTDAARKALGDSFVDGVFEFGGVFFENYTGTDDNTTVAIDADEARFFFTGVPGLYQESFAPADFLDTVNKPGLPRYARTALEPGTDQPRWVMLHTQQNPLPLCLRPQTLMKVT